MIDKSTELILWLKEFGKSWINIVSDKVVYGEQVFEKESRGISGIPSGRRYIKNYLSLNLWFEILIKIKRGKEFEFHVALIESSQPVKIEEFRMLQPSSDVNFDESRKYNPMFINVVNSRENPKRMPSFLPSRSVIRLHRFNLPSDILSKAIESSGEFTVPLKVDWEDSATITGDCKRPSDIVKGSSKSVRNLTYKQSPRCGEFLNDIGAEDIESILRVFLDSASIRVTCDEGSYFSVEDVKVFLSPIDASEGISHLLHILYFPQGDNNDKEGC